MSVTIAEEENWIVTTDSVSGKDKGRSIGKPEGSTGAVLCRRSGKRRSVCRITPRPKMIALEGFQRRSDKNLGWKGRTHPEKLDRRSMGCSEAQMMY